MDGPPALRRVERVRHCDTLVTHLTQRRTPLCPHLVRVGVRVRVRGCYGAAASSSTPSRVAASSTRGRAAAHDAIPAKRGEDEDERPAIGGGTARSSVISGIANRDRQ